MTGTAPGGREPEHKGYERRGTDPGSSPGSAPKAGAFIPQISFWMQTGFLVKAKNGLH